MTKSEIPKTWNGRPARVQRQGWDPVLGMWVEDDGTMVSTRVVMQVCTKMRPCQNGDAWIPLEWQTVDVLEEPANPPSLDGKPKTWNGRPTRTQKQGWDPVLFRWVEDDGTTTTTRVVLQVPAFAEPWAPWQTVMVLEESASPPPLSTASTS